ncbi:ABC transporter ATP-binding protein [Longimicrobium sp.]|uniref:ABC transporter ATP-binding protein n=1 Tax=Longimicrobium sp. TaxID=2029185 RepID=UPI002CF39497|nr:ABC transporter ATP-binding protein [Longimicrobium sp.]HSU17667.1 ABC transporter ATP-binding protein [Longimicrobium sp.]
MPAPSSTPTDLAVRAAGVEKTFRGGVRALDGVSFAVPAGELVALIGANGSGKSTLLKVLFGIAAPDAGSTEVMGMHPRRDRARLRAAAGYAGQDAALDPEMTGWETLRLFHALAALPRGDRERRLGAAVEEHGLAPFCARRVATWSGGQRQRLHLALAALHAPALMLLDEPTASLDPEGRRDLWRRLGDWRDARRTTFVATHDLADAAARCDRVLVMHGGRLVADDAPAALVSAHAKARATVTLAHPVGAQADSLRAVLAALPGSPEVDVDGAMVTLWRDRHPDDEPALEVLAAHGFGYHGYDRAEPDLAAAYFRLTGSRPAEPARAGARRGGGRGRRG